MYTGLGLQVLRLRYLLQVALHDWRNLSQRLHVFDGHSEEVFQVSRVHAAGAAACCCGRVVPARVM
jgi:hypothetical protein